MGPREAPKGRGRSIKTTPWRDLVPFCSFECITFAAGSILALFGHHFDTVLAHKKLPTGSACTLSVSGPAECAKRFESVAPLRDVLDASVNSCINSCINLHCMIFSHAEGLHAELCRRSRKPRRVLNPPYLPLAPRIPPSHPLGRIFSFFFSFFCIFFACKNLHENRHLIFRHFSQIFAISGGPDVDFNGFWAPKQVPGGSFFEAFFVLRFWMFFLHFFRKKRSKAKNEKVGFVL